MDRLRSSCMHNAYTPFFFVIFIYNFFFLSLCMLFAILDDCGSLLLLFDQNNILRQKKNRGKDSQIFSKCQCDDYDRKRPRAFTRSRHCLWFYGSSAHITHIQRSLICIKCIVVSLKTHQTLRIWNEDSNFH